MDRALHCRAVALYMQGTAAVLGLRPDEAFVVGWHSAGGVFSPMDVLVNPDGCVGEHSRHVRGLARTYGGVRPAFGGCADTVWCTIGAIP